MDIKLKSILIKNECTQAKFASESGVCLATINKICNNVDYVPAPLIQSKILNTLMRLGYMKSDFDTVKSSL